MSLVYSLRGSRPHSVGKGILSWVNRGGQAAPYQKIKSPLYFDLRAVFRQEGSGGKGCLVASKEGLKDANKHRFKGMKESEKG